MKIQKPENENYAATVVTIKSITQLEGCDNVVGTPIFGFQAIVGKDTKPGDIGIVFPAESQLSEEFARKNNLHRHGNLNDDEGATGYLEDNRRIRAMKFRGHRSDCLFMPLTSLSYIKKLNLGELSEGDTFDRLGDYEVCKKYVVTRPQTKQRIEKNKDKGFVRVDKKFLPEHYDSDNYFRYADTIPPERQVIVTQKLHGTSIRVGNTIVARKLSLLDKIAKRLGVSVKDQETDYIFGSRRVIKDVNNPNQQHFYSFDIWTDAGKRLEGLLPENYLVYAEVIGWTPDGAAIQQGYTYQLPVKSYELYVYRIAIVNSQGIVTDLTWDQIKEFCKDRGIKYVPELWRGQYKDFDVNRFVDHKFKEEGYYDALPLDDKDKYDEGVCIRSDGLAPYILKAKSPIFLQHESKMLDKEAVDMEAVGSNEQS